MTKQTACQLRSDFGPARHNLERRGGQRRLVSSTPTVVKLHDEEGTARSYHFPILPSFGVSIYALLPATRWSLITLPGEVLGGSPIALTIRLKRRVVPFERIASTH